MSLPMASDVTYRTYTDKELTELLKSDDDKAFTEIYQRYSNILYRFAWNILENEEECKDAVQEVFIWFWNNRRKLQIIALKFYLLAAIKHKLIRAIQKSKRKEEILLKRNETSISYMDNPLELMELKNFIIQFKEGLPPRAKEIFHLSREEYLSNKSIAEKMQISEKTVENQMTITLKKLKHSLRNSFICCLFL